MLQPFGYGGEMCLSGLEDIKHCTALLFSYYLLPVHWSLYPHVYIKYIQ